MAAAAPQFAEWISSEQVEHLSDELHDPDGVRGWRLKQFAAFRELPLEPNPLYRKYGYAAGVDLSGVDPVASGRAVPVPVVSDRSVLVVHDASGTRSVVPPALGLEGVILQVFPDGADAESRVAPDLLGREAPPIDRLAALSDALANRGYILRVPPNHPEPIQLHDVTMLSQPHEALSVHRRIEVGDRSRLAVTEEVYSATAPHGHQRWTSSQVDLALGAESQVVYVSVQAADPQAVGFFGRRAELGDRARLSWSWSGFGGFRTRIRNSSSLRGNGGDVEDLQTFFGDGDQSFDSAVDITHVGTDTHGQSVTRGVFRDRARGMSRGLVRIEKEARRTLSYLSEHAMLLSRGARSDTIPILEILCRDVKATHSTSVAPVDPEKVFYLEARGFPESEAVRMIGEGFLSYVLDRSPVEGLRELLYPLLSQRWEGVRSPFRTPGLGQLPDLRISGKAGVTDWRFDSKLR